MAPHFAIEDQQAVYDQLRRALKGAHCRRRFAIKLNVAVSEGEKLKQIGQGHDAGLGPDQEGASPHVGRLDDHSASFTKAAAGLPDSWS
jgi:hypothetical protein